MPEWKCKQKQDRLFIIVSFTGLAWTTPVYDHHLKITIGIEGIRNQIFSTIGQQTYRASFQEAFARTIDFFNNFSSTVTYLNFI